MQIGHVTDVPKESISAEGSHGAGLQWLLSKKDGVPHFFMRLVTVEPGGVIPLHKHEVIHEMFILRGKGAVLRPDGEIPVAEGNFIYMPSNEIHGTKNTGSEPLQFICCINEVR
jgi:quercetin dioxygenase-like cupin family protein